MLSCAFSARQEEVVAPQNVAYRLIRDRVPEVGQHPRDSVIAPVRIVLSHAQNQWFNFVASVRSASVSANLGPIERLDNELPVPAENRLRLGGVSHVHQCLEAEPITDFGECLFLRVGQE